MIFADNFDVPRGGRSISLDPWVVRMYRDDLAFKAALQANGISYSVEISPPYLPGQIEIRTMGNVVFRFQVEMEDDLDPLGLLGFYCRATRD